MIARYGWSTKRCIIDCGHLWLFLLVSIGCQPYHLPYRKIRAVPIATRPPWPTNHPLPTCRQMQTPRGKSWGLSRTELWLSALVQRDQPWWLGTIRAFICTHFSGWQCAWRYGLVDDGTSTWSNAGWGLGEPNATVTAEQRNMQFNAFDNRQSFLHQQAVYVNQDTGPVVASEAREAIAGLENVAQMRHEQAMNSSRNEEMAQQRLRMAESSLAGQAQEAYQRRGGDLAQLQQAEAQEMSKLRAELRSA